MKTRKPIPRRREFCLLAILLFAGLLAACWHLKGAELYREIPLLRLEAAFLESKHTSLLNTLQDQERIEAEWAALSAAGGDLPPAVPDFNRLPAVLESFEAFLDGFDLRIDSLHAGSVSFHDDHAAVDLNFNLSSGAFRLQSFLLALEGFTYPLVFESIKWVDRGGGAAALELEMNLIFLPPEIPVPEVECYECG